MNYDISKEPIVIQEVIDKVVNRNAGAVTTYWYSKGNDEG